MVTDHAAEEGMVSEHPLLGHRPIALPYPSAPVASATGRAGHWLLAGSFLDQLAGRQVSFSPYGSVNLLFLMDTV